MTNRTELRAAAESMVSGKTISVYEAGQLVVKWSQLAHPAAILSLLDELDAKDNTLLALTTRHFAESWSRRSTDAKLDEYLSAGIAQLQEERDAAFSQHARDSATLRELCQARDDARKERNAALADAKRLRREIKAFRNNSAISHAQMKWLDEILSKEAHNA